MELALFKASAPASLMLLGEHAVVYGKGAIALAVDKRIDVELTPRKDRVLEIDSDLTQYHSSIDDPQEHPQLKFVLKTIAEHPCPSGFRLKIRSAFSHQIGLGSSAAVTVATKGALCAWTGSSLAYEEMLLACVHIIRKVQGRGSGADVAASLWGGAIHYTGYPPHASKINFNYPITLAYCGYKTATSKVIEHVAQLKQRYPSIIENIFSLMDEAVTKAIEAIRQEQWEELGALMNIFQGFMDALGVNNIDLSTIVYSMRQSPTILGSKISGSGQGDCVIGLGKSSRPLSPYFPIDVSVSPQGLIIYSSSV